MSRPPFIKIEKNVFVSPTIPETFKDNIRSIVNSGEYGKLEELLTNSKIKLPFSESGLNTSLLHAVIQSSLTKTQMIKICTLLIKRGIAVDNFDENGFTPLYYAIKKQDFELVKLLIDSHAKLNKKINYFELALQPNIGQCKSQLFNIQDQAVMSKYYSQQLNLERELKSEINTLPITSDIIKYMLEFVESLPTQQLTYFDLNNNTLQKSYSIKLESDDVKKIIPEYENRLYYSLKNISKDIYDSLKSGAINQDQILAKKTDLSIKIRDELKTILDYNSLKTIPSLTNNFIYNPADLANPDLLYTNFINQGQFSPVNLFDNLINKYFQLQQRIITQIENIRDLVDNLSQIQDPIDPAGLNINLGGFVFIINGIINGPLNLNNILFDGNDSRLEIVDKFKTFIKNSAIQLVLIYRRGEFQDLLDTNLQLSNVPAERRQQDPIINNIRRLDIPNILTNYLKHLNEFTVEVNNISESGLLYNRYIQPPPPTPNTLNNRHLLFNNNFILTHYESDIYDIIRFGVNNYGNKIEYYSEKYTKYYNIGDPVTPAAFNLNYHIIPGQLVTAFAINEFTTLLNGIVFVGGAGFNITLNQQVFNVGINPILNNAMGSIGNILNTLNTQVNLLILNQKITAAQNALNGVPVQITIAEKALLDVLKILNLLEPTYNNAVININILQGLGGLQAGLAALAPPVVINTILPAPINPVQINNSQLFPTLIHYARLPGVGALPPNIINQITQLIGNPGLNPLPVAPPAPAPAIIQPRINALRANIETLLQQLSNPAPYAQLPATLAGLGVEQATIQPYLQILPTEIISTLANIQFQVIEEIAQNLPVPQIELNIVGGLRDAMQNINNAIIQFNLSNFTATHNAEVSAGNTIERIIGITNVGPLNQLLRPSQVIKSPNPIDFITPQPGSDPTYPVMFQPDNNQIINLKIISSIYHEKVFKDLLISPFYDNLRAKFQAQNPSINIDQINKLLLTTLDSAIKNNLNDLANLTLFTSAGTLVNKELLTNQPAKLTDDKIKNILSKKLKIIDIQRSAKQQQFYLDENYTSNEPIDIIPCLNNNDKIIELLNKKMNIDPKEYQELIFKLGNSDILDALNSRKKITKTELQVYLEKHKQKLSKSIDFLNEQLQNEIKDKQIDFMVETPPSSDYLIDFDDLVVDNKQVEINKEYLNGVLFYDAIEEFGKNSIPPITPLNVADTITLITNYDASINSPVTNSALAAAQVAARIVAPVPTPTTIKTAVITDYDANNSSRVIRYNEIYNDLINKQTDSNLYLVHSIRIKLIALFEYIIIPKVKEFLQFFADNDLDQIINFNNLQPIINNIIYYHMNIDPTKSKDTQIPLEASVTAFSEIFLNFLPDETVKTKLRNIFDERLKSKIIDLLMYMCKYYGSVYRNYLKYIFNDVRYSYLDPYLV